MKSYHYQNVFGPVTVSTVDNIDYIEKKTAYSLSNVV